MKKSDKSQHSTELLKLCPQKDTKGPETFPLTNVMVIDFMALVRKVSLRKLDPPVKTLIMILLMHMMTMVTKARHNLDEI